MNNDTTDEQARISQLYAGNKSAFHAAQESAAKGDWQSFEKTPVTNDTPADAITQADRLERFVRGHKGIWLDSKEVGEIASLLRHRTTSLAAQDGLVERVARAVSVVRHEKINTYNYKKARVLAVDYMLAEAALASIEVKSS